MATGRRGVTLRKTRVSVGSEIREEKLCPPCHDEFTRFGHKLTFAEWRRMYVRFAWANLRQTWRTLWSLLNPVRHWREVRGQYRFRARGEKVRSH